MCDDIWTAAKGMYKMEPAIANGGEVIVYAPHIDEVSYTHGHLLDEVGYHVRDYFLKQWDRFQHYPGGVLAHSTHLRGMGEYDATTRKESPRIKVTLATHIPKERCERLNLGYLNPDEIDLESWKEQTDDETLLVPKAGEMLYQCRPVSPDPGYRLTQNHLRHCGERPSPGGCLPADINLGGISGRPTSTIFLTSARMSFGDGDLNGRIQLRSL
jgi:hypothetical protein